MLLDAQNLKNSNALERTTDIAGMLSVLQLLPESAYLII